MTYPNDNLPERQRDRGMSMGIMGAIAAVLVAGLLIWGLTSRDSTTASGPNTSPGVTTGSSAPSPSNPPAMKGTGESNSTR